MKIKNNKLSLVAFLSLLIIIFTPITVNAATIPHTPRVQIDNDSSGISPCADDIRWVYQTIGTQLYRRQFNYTRNVWIGNWEPFP